MGQAPLMILVTGANGFIGRALSKRMIADGWLVRGAVRSADRAAQLPPGVEQVLIGEVGPGTDWSSALAGIETVVHLAARVHVADRWTEDSSEAHRLVNLAGTERLAHQAASHGVRRFVFLSTVKVHGEESPVPYDEDAPCMPRDPYGASKLEAEKVLRTIGRETGMQVVILRPPLVYGAGVKANVLRLMTIVQRGIPLPLASVNNRRSLIYLGNLTDAIVVCATNAKAAGRTFLVSDDEDVSTPELIRKIAYSLERPVRLVPFPIPFMRLLGKLTGRSQSIEKVVGSLVVDSGRIRRELNWKPPFTMAEGLKETADWFRMAMTRSTGDI
ncbi:MAG: NAD-dependent dehydratase [Nitrospirae bacterium GWC2_56_14]|nr:MAG: NAD-dependent dehydratase [Nitrospirae bacterium GWC2_56_14]